MGRRRIPLRSRKGGLEKLYIEESGSMAVLNSAGVGSFTRGQAERIAGVAERVAPSGLTRLEPHHVKYRVFPETVAGGKLAGRQSFLVVPASGGAVNENRANNTLLRVVSAAGG